ncbi:Hypothetical protein IALB_1943 [Ignavibacterium album JCM 16511]|uniref:Transporter n=1 Tax=Ignavibacterium album (strain DSM 19864 / JCM 16511 / NBRC 101810 / Mat9-16) TaxID=945713 RepID=I0AKZ2_IGNAJ|nr:hypothetical protein [Ignavibacterium album]AFH49649.1 Hypothetical protein IALB_1943 [Ignavibacterium album JCM 16511]
MKYILSAAIILFYSIDNLPQACCSAGTPMLGSLETSTTGKNNLQLNLTYDYNTLKSVFEGSKQIENDTRERVTNSILFETTYGLTDKLTLTGLFSFINQRRIITIPSGSENLLSSSGFGDAVILIKYELISQTILNQRQLAVGLGPKIPTGASDVTQNGILLPADMQPGSGSWDFVFWSYYSEGFMPYLPLNIFVTASFKLNTSNDRFANSDAGYKFGNEFVSSIGAGYRTDTIFDYSLALRIRATAVDQFDKESVPNTGGVWLYAVPGLNIKLLDNLITRFTGQIPVYRNLTGTQLTTTYTLSASFFYNHAF